MPKFGRTWWGARFIEAIEKFTDQARLSRGRNYAKGGKIVDFKIEKGKISATVRGSVNPFFGVYKEPKYKTTIELTLISPQDWAQLIRIISSKASFVSKLLMNEIPENIEEIFAEANLRFLPTGSKDFHTQCSCPDTVNPCKHIAGVIYVVAGELDLNPFQLFELRGLTKEELQLQLSATPFGRALSEELNIEEIIPQNAESFFCRPRKEKLADVNLTEFWTGKKKLSKHEPEPLTEASISAILIKKQGDFPPFWNKDYSFIESMEQFYLQVRTKNKNAF